MSEQNEPRTAAGADEQLLAQIFLQLLDGARQRRLLDVRPFSDTGEMEFFRYSEKAAQVRYFHRG